MQNIGDILIITNLEEFIEDKRMYQNLNILKQSSLFKLKNIYLEFVICLLHKDLLELVDINKIQCLAKGYIKLIKESECNFPNELCGDIFLKLNESVYYLESTTITHSGKLIKEVTNIFYY